MPLSCTTSLGRFLTNIKSSASYKPNKPLLKLLARTQLLYYTTYHLRQYSRSLSFIYAICDYTSGEATNKLSSSAVVEVPTTRNMHPICVDLSRAPRLACTISHRCTLVVHLLAERKGERTLRRRLFPFTCTSPFGGPGIEHSLPALQARRCGRCGRCGSSSKRLGCTLLPCLSRQRLLYLIPEGSFFVHQNIHPNIPLVHSGITSRL